MARVNDGVHGFGGLRRIEMRQAQGHVEVVAIGRGASEPGFAQALAFLLQLREQRERVMLFQALFQHQVAAAARFRSGDVNGHQQGQGIEHQTIEQLLGAFGRDQQMMFGGEARQHARRRGLPRAPGDDAVAELLGDPLG